MSATNSDGAPRNERDAGPAQGAAPSKSRSKSQERPVKYGKREKQRGFNAFVVSFFAFFGLIFGGGAQIAYVRLVSDDEIKKECLFFEKDILRDWFDLIPLAVYVVIGIPVIAFCYKITRTPKPIIPPNQEERREEIVALIGGGDRKVVPASEVVQRLQDPSVVERLKKHEVEQGHAEQIAHLSKNGDSVDVEELAGLLAGAKSDNSAKAPAPLVGASMRMMAQRFENALRKLKEDQARAMHGLSTKMDTVLNTQDLSYQATQEAQRDLSQQVTEDWEALTTEVQSVACCPTKKKP